MNTENNKMIAEFMGYRMNEKSENDYAKTFLIDTDGKRFAQLSALKFHTSWDWLMPVVEKIEGLPISSYKVDLGFDDIDGGIDGHIWFQRIGLEVETYFNVYYWQPDMQIRALKTSKGITPIIATYNAIVQFIQWYNQTPHP